MNDSRDMPSSSLIHAGLRDLDAARACFDRLADHGFERSHFQTLLAALGRACDADTAVMHLVQIVDLLDDQCRTALADDQAASTRLVGVLGASDAMGRLMLADPAIAWAAAFDTCASHAYTRGQRIDRMRQTVSARSFTLAEATEVLRRDYYLQLAAIMAQDVEADDPVVVQPAISRKLSDLADAALEAALSIAKAQVPEGQRCRFAVIGMGKLGARELNYVSDVDLIYVVEPVRPTLVPDGSYKLQTTDAATRHDVSQDLRTERVSSVSGDPGVPELSTAELTLVGTRIATTLQKICQSVIAGVTMPPLWQIDGGLRPEGKDGPLVRTLTSHKTYYETWADDWEFQALLKARAVAGDKALGGEYEAMAKPFVWTASQRPNFVTDCQRMRTRVEEGIPPALRDREIKLGRGGLRDVEFTVQMLQLVHGRSDESLRGRGTLETLRALADGGYVSRLQAARLDEDYRFERVLEHRQQMWGLKRTHLFADLGGQTNTGGLDSVRRLDAKALSGNAELTRLARAFGLLPDCLVERYDATRREVRRLHTDIYYRPMLSITSSLDDEEVMLSEKATKERFASIGFADPDAAMRHVKALTSGLSRAAKINRIILPSVLQWLSEGQDPDMGLLQWRKLEENFGGGSPYLGFLRDSPLAARRLCRILSDSRILGDALGKSIESVNWLGDDEKLKVRSRESLDTRAAGAVERYAGDTKSFATSLRAMRRQEIERIGLGWTCDVVDQRASLTGMTDVYDSVIDAALTWSVNRQIERMGLDAAPAQIAVIGMGRYGGREVNFSSDADVILLYRPMDPQRLGCVRAGEDAVGGQRPDVSPAVDAQAAVFARHVVADLREVLQGPVSVEAGIDLDLGLRPEGRSGPLIRSFSSCRQYYTSWFSTWERQALLRARFAAGSETLAKDFLMRLADPLRYMDRALTEDEIAEIRKLKARMESERLPRGVARNRHLKLGTGGLSDVEWTVQLLQLEHAGVNPGLRVTSTLAALAQLERLGIVVHEDATVLREAWTKLTAARNGNYLWSGRASQADVLPSDLDALSGVATFLGYDPNSGQYFENDLTAVMRRCREVAERLFYGR